jgi:hypothetical protein
MIINKSQGQSFQHVGLDLQIPYLRMINCMLYFQKQHCQMILDFSCQRNVDT